MKNGRFANKNEVFNHPNIMYGVWRNMVAEYEIFTLPSDRSLFLTNNIGVGDCREYERISDVIMLQNITQHPGTKCQIFSRTLQRVISGTIHRRW
jgi:hypothetical protein